MFPFFKSKIYYRMSDMQKFYEELEGIEKMFSI